MNNEKLPQQPRCYFPTRELERVEWDLAEPVGEWLDNVVSGTLNGTLPITEN